MGELEGQRWIEMLPGERHEPNLQLLTQYTPEQPVHYIQNPIILEDGSERWLEWTSRALRMIGVVHDITERREAENLLQYLSYHDVLTELPNRALFRERAGQTASRAGQSGESFAVVHLGLDRFKRVNDLHQGDGGAAIIRTILSLADNLGMESVAEGVETVTQYEFLHNEGCHTIQGNGH